MTTDASIEATVNGRRVDLDTHGDPSLLMALRDQLGLKGARIGCGVGECGACMVLVDDVAVRSCTTPVGDVAAARVTTPEGLGDDGAPHPVQRAFNDLQAAQCGYCISGMTIAVAALQARGEAVTDDELRSELDPNICRCGTHARILQAARRHLGIGQDASAGPNFTANDRVSSCRYVERGPVEDDPTDFTSAADTIIERNPRVEQWLVLRDDGVIELHSGRSEIGQGVLSALRQIAAAHIGLDVEHVVVRSASTHGGPDEGYTAASTSMAHGGLALARVATAFKRLLLVRAADLLETDPEDLVVEPDGRIHVVGSEHGTSLVELGARGPVTGAVEPSDVPSWGEEGAIGQVLPREDLAGKVMGAPVYLHDMDLPDMLHARAVLPPTYDAELVDTDVEGVESMRGVAKVIRDGRLLIVVATDQTSAMKAAEALQARCRWDDPGLELTGSVADTFRTLETTPYVERQDDGVDDALARGTRVTASYSKPYQLHGAMAPSCAIAHVDDGHLTVWSHTQGVYPLRRELETLLDLPGDAITVRHVDGPGCYGQNGADDVAAFAAVAAQHVPGRHVRFQFSSADEFAWEPFGSAMLADLDASLDDRGRVVGWRHIVLTDSAVSRPGGQGDRLSVAWLRSGGTPRPFPGPQQGGARDSGPLYDFPTVEAIADHVDGPLRVGALRSLGSFLNHFAAESFMDELAEAASEDPLAFRLRHLRDPRARDVLETAAEAAGWQARIGPSGGGQGLALARYHRLGAYVAVVAEVDVDFDEDRIAVVRLVLAADAGTVISPDGLRQQLEGGALQGLSRTIHEQLPLDRRGVASHDWSTYPVLRFSDVPQLDLTVLDRRGMAPLGAGEASTPAVPAAVANAIDDAAGIRMRDLPITPSRVRDRLLHLTEQEMQRVLVG